MPFPPPFSKLMSQIGYSGYSPYFQHNYSGQEGLYQDSSSGGVQRHPYAPTAPGTQPQRSPAVSVAADRPSSTYMSQAYNSNEGNLRGQDARDGTVYGTSERHALDTTALGNLAYASTLGQDSRQSSANSRAYEDRQPVVDYNRTASGDHDTSTYNDGNSSCNPNSRASVNRGNQPRSYGQEAANPRAASTQYTSNTQSANTSGVQANTYDTRYHQTSSSGPSNTQSPYAQHGNSQPAYALPNPIQMRQTSQQPSRPGSVQSAHNVGPQHEPRKNGPQPAKMTSSKPPSPNIKASRRSNTGTPNHIQQQPQSTNAQQPGTSSIWHNHPSPSSVNNQTNTGSVHQVHMSPQQNTSSYQQNSTRIPQPHQSHVPEVATSQQSPTNSNLAQQQYPATIDPNEVFNHFEYRRRQAEAAAEAQAAKKAAESAALMQDGPIAPVVNGVVTQADPSASPARDPDSYKKEQMEAEMKAMIEKMRDYKSKDPSLFTQIWEQVKKAPPPKSSTPSQTVQSTAPPGQSQKVASPQLPVEAELPAAPSADSPGLEFDRGKYPMKRRRRGGKSDGPARKASMNPTAADTASPSQPSPYRPQPPSPPIFGAPQAPSSDSMQNAMQKFNSSVNIKQPFAQTNRSTSIPQVIDADAGVIDPVLIAATAASKNAQKARAKHEAKPKKAPGATLWPEENKNILAEAASLTLNLTNEGMRITPEEIRSLLDQNPSYMELCETIEKKGFTIDRPQFARTLLNAVPHPNPKGATNGQSQNNTTKETAPGRPLDRRKGKVGNNTFGNQGQGQAKGLQETSVSYPSFARSRGENPSEY